MTAPKRRDVRRARRSFWVLFVVAVLLTGALSRVLAASPSPVMGLAVALIGVVLAVVLALEVRLLLALTAASRGKADRPNRR